MPDLLTSQQKYKKKYKQVIDGFSFFIEKNKTIYVKHISDMDIGTFEVSTDLHFDKAKKDGLPTEEESLKLLIKQEIWSNEKEEKIKKLRLSTAILQDTHKKLFLKGQIAKSQKLIDKNINELSEIIREREETLGLTCEKYSEKKSNEEIVLECFFKNSELKEKFFTREEFDELHRDELYSYIQKYNEISREFSLEEMKRMSALPFFVNLFFLCDDNPCRFYGKSITKLTIPQIDAFNSAKTYKAIMSQGNTPPDEMYEDLDKLVSFYESYSSNDGEALKEAKSKDSQTIVGATISEMKKMTKGHEEGDRVTTLEEEERRLKKEGRSLSELSMQEIVKMHQ